MAEAAIDSRYEIRQKLGQGATGVVYKVFDPVTKRLLALKVLKSRGEDRDGTSRFQREFHAIRRLQHPNIVKVHDLHQNYFTMELVEGKPLEPSEVQDFATLVSLTVEICRALRYIHAQGMIHGDLKPAHVLVPKDAHVKLIDFGLAHEVDLVRGELAGTLDYLAPEQARGLAADPRSDLYSLGVILYECCTRRLPFEAEDPVALIMKHVSAVPLPPREIDRRIPKALDAIILKLLEKDPAQRIQSAEELMDRLVSLGARQEIRAGRVETGSHLLYAPRLVGRDEPLAELAAAMARAEGGTPQQILVRGAPGTGKSRVLSEFRAAQLLRKVTLLSASNPSQGRSYPPLADLLEQACFALERVLPEEDLHALGERCGGTLLRFAPDLAEKPWMAKARPRLFLDLRRSVKDLLEILKALASRAERAVALVVDDAERADPAHLQVLSGVAAGARGLPLMMLWAADEGGTRRATAPLLEEFAARGQEGAATLTLSPLSTPQVNALIASMIGKSAVEEGFATRLATLSKGSPLVVEEMVRSLADRGDIFKQGGKWQSRIPSFASLSLPRSHEERLLAKARELPESARGVLGAAALIHHGITVDLLSEVTHLDAAELFEILADLVRQGFLTEVRERGGRVYSLSSERLDAWAYEQVPPKQRLKGHDAVAKVLEETAADRPGALAEDLGHHLARGREPARAVPSLVAAGDQAGEAMDPKRATELYRLALTLGAETLAPAALSALRTRLGQALLALSEKDELEEAERILGEAVAGARRAGEPLLLVAALSAHAAALIRRRAFAEAETAVREWIGATTQAGDMHGLAEATTTLGDLQRLAGEREAAIASYAKGMAVAEKLAGAHLLARAALGRGLAALALGRNDEAREVLARAAEALRQEDPAALLPEVLIATGEGKLASGEIEEAAVLLRRLAPAEAQLERPARGRFHRLACLTALAQGEFGAAQRHYRAAARILEGLGDEGALGELAVRYAEAGALAARDTAVRVRAEGPHLLKEAQERFARWGLAGEAERAQQVAARAQEALSGTTQSIKAERDNLVFLQEVLRVMNSELDLERLLSLVMDMVIEILQAERGFLMLLDEAGRLSFSAARNLDRETIAKPEFKVSNTIAKKVLETGKPILTQDAQADERFKKRLSISNLKLRSILCVPLRHKERILGIVYVDNRFVSERFNEENLRLLGAFADQAGTAIENARLVAEIRSQKAELEKANTDIRALNRRLEGQVAVQRAELREAHSALAQGREGRPAYPEIVGRSPPMQELFGLLDRIAPTGVPVLVEGESGTGKELVARAIHAKGPRADKAFVSENCAAVSPTLLESELFGYVKGAFTGADTDKPGLFEAADGGTLFLDEVGEMPLEMQSKFLRALENGEVRPVGSQVVKHVDVRIVAATNRTLQDLVREGRFREDLYYRLNVVKIILPPLRERREDIALLVESFLLDHARRNGGDSRRILPEALELLAQRDWPGNVRELRNFLERLLLLSPEPEIRPEDVRKQTSPSPGLPLPAFESAFYKVSRRQVLDQFDRAFVEKALERHAGNVSAAASEAGIERQYFHKIMKRFAIRGEEFRTKGSVS